VPEPHSAVDIAGRALELYRERLGANAQDGVLVGIGAPREDLAEARGSWREARLAVRAGRAVPAFRPTAVWAELGIYRLLACGPQRELRDAVVDPAVRRLLPEPELLHTAQTYLDHAGSAQHTAAALNIHRQTLYHRLAKIERITGLDLADGRDRLRLHLGVSLAPLVNG
jgi:sugar diacid utilization regulator